MIIITVIIVINLLAFLAAYKLQTDKLTDVTYCLSFFIGIWIAYSNDPSVTSLVVAIAISLWAFRLGIYLFYRVHLNGLDHRFDSIRASFTKFALFWILQASSILIILTPCIIMFPRVSDDNYPLLICAVFIFLLGLGMESIADYQKFQFRRNSDDDQFCSIGLWKITQHPNYLGEIICWWALYIPFFPSMSGWLWITLCGPIWITILLTKISGIPLLQDSWNTKYGHLDSFKDYSNSTPLLIPKLPYFRG